MLVMETVRLQWPSTTLRDQYGIFRTEIIARQALCYPLSNGKWISEYVDNGRIIRHRNAMLLASADPMFDKLRRKYSDCRPKNPTANAYFVTVGRGKSAVIRDARRRHEDIAGDSFHLLAKDMNAFFPTDLFVRECSG